MQTKGFEICSIGNFPWLMGSAIASRCFSGCRRGCCHRGRFLGAAFKPFATAVVHNGLSGEDLVDEDADLQVGAFIEKLTLHYAFISIISHIATSAVAVWFQDILTSILDVEKATAKVAARAREMDRVTGEAAEAANTGVDGGDSGRKNGGDETISSTPLDEGKIEQLVKGAAGGFC